MSDYGYNPQFTPQQPPPPIQMMKHLAVGDVLQTAAQIVGANLGAFLFVAFIFTLPSNLISGLMTWLQAEQQVEMQAVIQAGNMASIVDMFSIWMVIGGLISGVLAVMLVYMGMGVLVYAGMEHIAGRTPSLGEVISHGLRRSPAVALIALIVSLIDVLAFLPGMVIFGGGSALLIGAAPSAAGLMCCLGPFGLLAMLIPSIYVTILFLLAVPVAVMEKTGPIQALEKSVMLTKGHRLPIFLVLLILGLTLFLVLMIFGCVGGIAAISQLDPTSFQPTAASGASQVITIVAQFVSGMIRIIVIAPIVTVIYARLGDASAGVDAGAIAQVFR